MMTKRFKKAALKFVAEALEAEQAAAPRRMEALGMSQNEIAAVMRFGKQMHRQQFDNFKRLLNETPLTAALQ